MPRPTTVTNHEVYICGVTFEVDFEYYAGCPATLETPAALPSIDLIDVRVRGQHDADTEELLMRLSKTERYAGRERVYDGCELLERAIYETYRPEDY